MEEYVKLEEKLWKSHLVDLQHAPFSKQGTLIFRLNGQRLRVDLKGIHFWSTRQSLLGIDRYVPISEKCFEAWNVHVAAIHGNCKFLTNFVNNSLDLESKVCLYDSDEKTFSDGSYKQPMHLLIVTGGGHLDVLCETIYWEEIV